MQEWRQMGKKEFLHMRKIQISNRFKTNQKFTSISYYDYL